MRQWTATRLAKLARQVSRAAGKKGTDLPGQVARKVDKNILRELASHVDEIVFISGTNGKTTTSNLIGHTLKENHIEIIHNNEGANMAAGITSAFILQIKKETKIAVIEIDEGSIPRVLNEVTPTMMVVTNFFRDQMDRFGEIDIMVNNIANAINNKGIKLLLNADDPFVSRLKTASDIVIYYGMKKNAHNFEQSLMNESRYCPNCGRLLHYDYIHYNQLGHYYCECGFKREETKYEVTQFDLAPFINLNVGTTTFNMKIAGDFNAYNAIAAYTVLRELGLNDESIQKGFESYTSDNGRMQYFKKGKKEAMINLAKNPAGMNASLSVGEQIEGNKIYVISLNDYAADGRDTSWIYDADFEKLVNQQIETIIVTGTRAEELQLRLKLAGVEAPIILEKDIYKATAKTMNYANSFTVAIPNYTSLSPMLKQLNHSFEEDKTK
ncbi:MULTISPECIES: Mur ligase family protein [Staphylococcus]|jgi:UDP-N-acetylmuramyl tripeptide synthase|uniref:Lipid II isoglutaminyl synthase (glutamine-hydrolyzing) subunit MurT n=1 Tax=Staphylococcus nepalensis TaxID=214473 RepID=A0A2T4SC03_9STAP|nr:MULTISPECIES: Mur ligase family protein [Staphylococcus]VDG66677.1 UDP-N-acetylmuramyl tripeptide synthetase [Lacrimispora indolis]MBO1206856.1 Mur ligase family protein [Staphylococcus nepalensis]MBO1213100.1 Mur ligase family protein [Staphylococcus nepalensis]MBO1217203.1 Mur ligase family protein [Staphylococcus nepalensis]MBO1222468.1 Mur ligase family protein [Staphylococcus nepalensis]